MWQGNSLSRCAGLYFNDEVYVGWVRGGDVVEVSAVDPVLKLKTRFGEDQRLRGRLHVELLQH